MPSYCVELLENQDFMHRVNLAMTVSIELYRVLVSTLLILFVPQDCLGKLCTIKDNLKYTSTVYSGGIAMNFIALFSFIVLYGIEIVREDKLIKYFDVNSKNPRDNENLEIIFSGLPDKYKTRVYNIDYYYQKAAYISLVIFVINTIYSGRIIYEYSLGNQTTTTFITNVLFMTTKVYDTFYIANTEKYVFYSAYMRDKVQFNDLDAKLKKRLSGTYSPIDENDCEIGLELVSLKESNVLGVDNIVLLDNQPESNILGIEEGGSSEGQKESNVLGVDNIVLLDNQPESNVLGVEEGGSSEGHKESNVLGAEESTENIKL